MVPDQFSLLLQRKWEKGSWPWTMACTRRVWSWKHAFLSWNRKELHGCQVIRQRWGCPCTGLLTKFLCTDSPPVHYMCGSAMVSDAIADALCCRQRRRACGVGLLCEPWLARIIGHGFCDFLLTLSTLCHCTSPSCLSTLSLVRFTPIWLALSLNSSHPIHLFAKTSTLLLWFAPSKSPCGASPTMCSKIHQLLEMIANTSIIIFQGLCLMTTSCSSHAPPCGLLWLATLRGARAAWHLLSSLRSKLRSKDLMEAWCLSQPFSLKASSLSTWLMQCLRVIRLSFKRAQLLLQDPFVVFNKYLRSHNPLFPLFPQSVGAWLWQFCAFLVLVLI